MSLFDAIKAFDVRDYLDRFGKVSKSGGDNVTVNPCPICGDRHNKFYANVSIGTLKNGTFNSYCCHREGGLIDLIQASEDVDRFEATYQIERAFEGEDSHLVPVVEREKPKEQPRFSLQVPDPLFAALPEYPCWVKDHFGNLEERGVDQYIIDRHRLRITQGSVHLYGKRREDLDNRLVIPVFQTPDTLLSWQARDLTGRAERKYLFPAGDQSSSTFYDLHNHAGSTVMIVEGAFHKWAWDKLGRDLGQPAIERMAVASFGKKLTEAQVTLLMGATHIRRVIIGWDLDAAPQIVRIADMLNGRKELLVMPAHPSGRDHDELDRPELMNLMASAEPWSPELGVLLTTSLALGRM